MLALSYQEFCLRLGHQVRGLAITAIMDTVIDEGSEEADTQFALIHRALLAAYDEKGFFEYSLRSVIQGSNEPLPLTVVDQMARKAAAEMPFGGDDRAREAYQFLARGLKSSRSYRTLRSFL